jgi:hypothetical protein
VGWYENQGGGNFGPQQVIIDNTKADSADGCFSVFATDLNGNGDTDVLSACGLGDEVARYVNHGGGNFGPQPQQAITTNVDRPFNVYATDLDGDSDADVLSASSKDDKIAWYKNQGGGNFGPQQVISTNTDYARSVYAIDLDGDGDADVLSASSADDKIAWYENKGGSFGPQQVITTNAKGARCVYATDLDGDGDADVLSASYDDDKIAWYENQGGSFGPQQAITTNADGAQGVYAKDLDGDGDADVLSASQNDDKIAWYENQGGGSFGPQQVITTNAVRAFDVYAKDLDGDGDQDVLSASALDDKIAWYENKSIPLPVKRLALEAHPRSASIQLRWHTHREVNTSGYELQRAVHPDSCFHPIAWQPSQGNRPQDTSYRFVDNQVRAGQIYYYRVALQDLESNLHYSQLTSARIKQAKPQFELSPNPVHQELQIKMQGLAKGKHTLKWQIISLTGRQVRKGSHRFHGPSGRMGLRLGNLAQGVYQVQLHVKGWGAQQRLLVE